MEPMRTLLLVGGILLSLAAEPNHITSVLSALTLGSAPVYDVHGAV